MRRLPHQRPDRGPLRPAEYRRLVVAGVNPHAAVLLATAIPAGAPVLYTRQDNDERAYWRAQAAGRRASHAAYVAHARAQAERRAARRAA